MIVTPIGGYLLIEANNVTIDGYSQPWGACGWPPGSARLPAA